MRSRNLLTTLVLALAAAGCGGGDDGSSAHKPDAAPNKVQAAMQGFEFVPDAITVAKGGTVTWTDKDSSNHNVTFRTDGAPKGIPNIQGGKTASVTFDKAGSYDFVCTLHPNMRGTVTVSG